MNLVYDEDDLDLLRAIRDAVNPRGLANPGKILPDPVPAGAAVRP
jgi:FAD/FMN-containing dehydrogenase